jgi:hypothetical protein
MEYVYEHQYPLLPEVVLRRLCTISQRSHDNITCTTTLLAVPVSWASPRSVCLNYWCIMAGKRWPFAYVVLLCETTAKWLSLFEAVQNCCSHPQTLVSMLAIQVNHLVLVSLSVCLFSFWTCYILGLLHYSLHQVCRGPMHNSRRASSAAWFHIAFSMLP